MNKEQKIAEKFGRDAGFKAPEGFLEQVYAQVEAKRGSMPEFEPRQTSGFWQKIRPYVALAAMFAGIWCMMKVVDISRQHIVSEPMAIDMTQPVSLDNPPQALAQAVTTTEVQEEIQFSDAVAHSTEADMELVEDIQESYSDFDDFEKAFDYDFEDQYADIDIEALMAEAQ